jgi:hypothetical protein
MTPLQKPVRRLSQSNGVNRRQYIVTLAPGDIIGFRDARTRTTYWTPLALCYAQAVRAEVARQRAEKSITRKRSR